MARGPSKYTPFTASLATRAPNLTTLTRTFAQIEAIVGSPLPRSARRQGWWGHSASANQARVWHTAGWRVTKLPRPPGGPPRWEVTFARAASDMITTVLG
jgi:hypothetical protein